MPALNPSEYDKALMSLEDLYDDRNKLYATNTALREKLSECETELAWVQEDLRDTRFWLALCTASLVLAVFSLVWLSAVVWP